MAALKGDIAWHTSSTWLDTLKAHGADSIVLADITNLLKQPPYNGFDEHFNALGFYKKKYQATWLIQVRKPGEEPDLSKFGYSALNEPAGHA